MSSKPTVPELGKVFGVLEVIDNNISRNKHNQVCVTVKCINCYSTHTVSTNYLQRVGRIQSKRCNKCAHHEWGDKRRSLFIKWRNIYNRCHNSEHESYPSYGEQGITVCDEWQNDFLTFFNWALNNNYEIGLQIDRIDPSLGYCPENCRFVTISQNYHTKRPKRTAFSKYKGVTFNKGAQKWRAMIACNHQKYYLGTFETEIDAALAYNEKARELFGEFAYQNKIDTCGD